MQVRERSQTELTTDSLPSEPLSRRNLGRLAASIRGLAETIEAVGLAESVRDEVDRLRLTICDFLRWEGFRAEDPPLWIRQARDALLEIVKVLGWCARAYDGKHDKSEIVQSLRRLAGHSEKVAGGQVGPAQGWTQEEAAEILAGLRTLAAAVNGSPAGHDMMALAARIDWALANIYGELHWYEIGDGKAIERTLDDAERCLAVVTTKERLREIEERRATADCGAKLGKLADNLEAWFNRQPAGTGAESEPDAGGDKGATGDGDRAGAGLELVKGVAYWGQTKLDVPMGKAIEVFGKLVENLGKPVTYRELDCEGERPKEADDQTKQAVRRIKIAFQRAKAPYGVANLRGVGYCMQAVMKRKTKSG